MGWARRALGAFLYLLVLVSTVQAQPSPALSQKAPDAASMAAAAEAKGYVPVIIEFASPALPGQITSAAALAQVKARVAAAQDAIIATHFGGAVQPSPGQGFQRSLQRMSVSPMFAVNASKAELEALAVDPRVIRIHENKLSRTQLIDSVPLIGMTGGSGAYALGATGAGQAVAVVDTGVMSSHKFLSGKVVSEACFSNGGGGANRVSLCPNGQNSQSGAGAGDSTTAQCVNGSTQLCAHGTHVAGIAAGANTNQLAGEPPNGVAKNAKIVAVQVFTRFNSDTDCGAGMSPCVAAWSSDQISALDWLYQNALTPAGGVSLASVNMSLGGGSYTSACDTNPLKPSIDNLKSAGVATAIAAGNDGSTSAVSAPGCISTAVTVGSSTKSDTISSFSNMASMVDLMAPGSSIQSSVPTAPNPSSVSTFAFYSGTSMATPHVAGAFAAVRSAVPSATVDQILSALQSTGVSIVDNRPGGTQTKPRIRVDLAVAQLQSAGPTLTVTPGTGLTASGPQGGPFSPSSFSYQLSASSGSVNWSISGAPSWLTPSATSGTATTTPTTVTFTVNSAANSLGVGTYNATITFTNATNGSGTQTRAAALTVNCAPPANDNFATAATILANQTVTGSNVCATKEAGEPNHAGNSGGKSVWWNFTAPASGSTTIRTTGSNFDTLLAVYTGNAVNALALVAQNDDEGGGLLTSLVTFNATAGTAYRIAVDGYNGGSGAASGNIQLAVAAPAPPTCTLTASPSAINQGQSSTLSWSSTNATGGTITPGVGSVGASGSLSVAPAQTTQYTGTFTGAAGSATCSATVTVYPLKIRVFVSGRGGDAAGCGAVASPCRTFQYAHDAVTAGGGEIVALDAGDYGTLNIAKPLSVINEGAGLAISGGITVNAGASDLIFLRGLTVENLGSATEGLNVMSAGGVTVSKCVFRNFGNNGIRIVPSVAMSAHILDTFVERNGASGVFISGGAPLTGTLARVTANDNGLYGIYVGSSSASNFTITNSAAARNGLYGVSIADHVSAVVSDTIAVGHVSAGNGAGFVSSGAGAVLRLSRSGASGNDQGLIVASGGALGYSYGDNRINGNGTDVAGTLAAIPKK